MYFRSCTIFSHGEHWCASRCWCSPTRHNSFVLFPIFQFSPPPSPLLISLFSLFSLLQLYSPLWSHSSLPFSLFSNSPPLPLPSSLNNAPDTVISTTYTTHYRLNTSPLLSDSTAIDKQLFTIRRSLDTAAHNKLTKYGDKCVSNPLSSLTSPFQSLPTITPPPLPSPPFSSSLPPSLNPLLSNPPFSQFQHGHNCGPTWSKAGWM